MGHPRYPRGEIARIGEETYQRELRARVETESNLGKVLVLDIESGDYEIDEDHRAAILRVQAKHPDGALYSLRIGFPALAKMGGGWVSANP